MEASIRFVHWSPRIICILAILFISLFAADAFAPGLTIWQQLGDFFIHLIPSFILLLFLIVSWKWELIGGIFFTVIGLGLSPFVFMHNYHMNHSISLSLIVILMITFPFVVVGILFIISHFMKKRHTAIGTETMGAPLTEIDNPSRNVATRGNTLPRKIPNTMHRITQIERYFSKEPRPFRAIAASVVWGWELTSVMSDSVFIGFPVFAPVIRAAPPRVI